MKADTSLHRPQGGLGIGLTLVRHLTELHHGSVECRSAGRGKGAEFVIRLPATVVDRSPATLAPVLHLHRKPAMRVLIVDDLVASAESLEALLTIHGYIVKCTGDGESALRLAGEMRPDVVILDIGLPGMSGHEVARRLRQDPTCGQCLIVALSGYGQEEHIRRATEAGVDHYLVKPADPSALLDSISMSEKRRGSDGVAVS